MSGRLKTLAIAVALAGPASLAQAQGSGVMTHSSCAVGLGAAGAGSPCEDGSAVLFNPAALAFQPNLLSVGVTAVRSPGRFTFDRGGGEVNRTSRTSWVPYGYLNYGINPKLSAALGVFAPYGLGITWPETFEGRYVSYDSRHTNYYVQPTIAYAASPHFSVGAGLDVIFSNIEINQRLDLAGIPLPSQPLPGRTLTFGSVGIPVGTDFAGLRLTGRGTGLSFHLSALARLGERVAIGARYLHSSRIRLKGDADFSPVLTNVTLPPGNPLSAPGNAFGFPAGSAVPLDPVLFSRFTTGGPLEDQDISTGIELPAQFVVGVAVTPIPAVKVVGDYQWTGWKSFDEVNIDFSGAAPQNDLILNYQNASTFRGGIEYEASSRWSLRTGYTFNTSALPDFSVSPLLPEAERNYYSVGIGWHMRPNITLDAAYQYIDQSRRRGRVRGRTADQTDDDLEALDVGVYSSSGHVFSATFAYQFGADR
jgi:long-chain fatty acid transport protein